MNDFLLLHRCCDKTEADAAILSVHTHQGLFSTGGGRGKKQFKGHIRSTLLQLLSKRLPIKIKVNIKRYI